MELHEVLRGKFLGWLHDPFPGNPGDASGYKYSGFLHGVSDKVRGEFQILSMLVGLFWESRTFGAIQARAGVQRRGAIIDNAGTNA
jgi:hypothetical protein